MSFAEVRTLRWPSFIRPANTGIGFVTWVPERLCALQGVAVRKDYLIKPCPTESELAIP